MGTRLTRFRAPWLAALLLGCHAARVDPREERPEDGPYVLVLGTAQDGGLPQIGCEEEACVAARRDPAFRRRVTSLLLCDPRDGRRWLFDCTPDVGEQLELARGHPATRRLAGPRPALFEGLFLTHAHIGHYGGLLELGREAYGAHDLATWVTPRFAGFLRTNGPWSALVDEGRLALHELAEGEPVRLAHDLSVVARRVPHRDEFSDTVGFEIRGPRRTLLYLPDIDKWEAFDTFEGGAPGSRRIERWIEACDVALLDGCFAADGEIPGRSLAEIPHPFLCESLARFASLLPTQRAKILFTHLNHTNPAARADSPAARAVRAAGMGILAEGQRFGL